MKAILYTSRAAPYPAPSTFYKPGAGLDKRFHSSPIVSFLRS